MTKEKLEKEKLEKEANDYAEEHAFRILNKFYDDIDLFSLFSGI